MRGDPVNRIKLAPKPGINEHTHNPARPLLAYRSSVDGTITIALDVDGSGRHREGLRLDTAQVTALRDFLTDFLADRGTITD